MSGFYEIGDPGFKEWFRDLWGMSPCRVCRDVRIEGSPERSHSRVVVETAGGRRFLVEKFTRQRFMVRDRVARTLDFLNRQGLNQALAGLKTNTGAFLPFYGDFCYQVTPFLDGTELPRPGWLASAELGREMAGFLIRMRNLSRSSPGGIDFPCDFPRFSLKNYIHGLFRDMAAHAPDRAAQYRRFLDFLAQRFMDRHDDLPLAFCHGDYHPLNVIWEGERIRAVIDWEFTGIKPDVYDAANLVGCAGIEHPEGLAGPMVTTFLARLRESGIVSPRGWFLFPEYVLALRFAWLSEWLRKKDREMLEMEADFMDILIRHMDDLRKVWGLDPQGGKSF